MSDSANRKSSSVDSPAGRESRRICRFGDMFSAECRLFAERATSRFDERRQFARRPDWVRVVVVSTRLLSRNRKCKFRDDRSSFGLRRGTHNQGGIPGTDLVFVET